MSFLYILNKNNTKIDVNLDLLSKNICPYDLLAQKYEVGSQQLYFNSHSGFDQGCLKTPKNHQCEPQAAWIQIDIVQEQCIVRTDPLGQVPIWIFENDQYIAISCEKKAFKAIHNLKLKIQNEENLFLIKPRNRDESEIENLRKVPAGSEIHIIANSSQINIKESRLPWDYVQPEEQMTTDTAQDILYKALCKSAQTIPDFSLASFLSGGIDSSVATALCRSAHKTYNLKTYRGSEEAQSQETSTYLNRKSVTIDFKENKTFEFFKDSIFCNEIYDGLTAEIILQMSALVQNESVREDNLVSGYGADLLFGGMLGHKEYLQVTGVKDTQSLLNRTYWSKEMSPFYYWKYHKRLFHMYWHPDVISAALTIPLALQQQKVGTEKFILRSLAVKYHLIPESMAFRIKTGMTNGTQMHYILSQTLSLPNEYSFDLKTKKAYEIYRQLFLD